jgi:hypothetical protein
MKKALLFVIVAAAAVIYPAASSAGVFHGVVIAKEKTRHTLVVATRGHVRTIRTHARTGVSARVKVRAHRLHDGTFRAAHVARAGRAQHTRFHATVVKRTSHRLLVSAGRSTFDVHMASRHRRIGRGDKVVLNVSFSKNGELDEDGVKEVGHSNQVELEGTVTALTAPTADQAGSLTLSTDEDEGDDDNGSTSFTVVIPAGFDIGSLGVGDEVELTASVDGSTYTLVSLDDDQGDDDGGGGGDD